MASEKLSDCECSVAGTGFVYGVAVAVGVTVGSERGRQKELPAASGIFVAGS